MKAVLIALAIIMWLLSLLLSWINCRQRERLAERADDLEKKLESAIMVKEEFEEWEKRKKSGS